MGDGTGTGAFQHPRRWARTIVSPLSLPYPSAMREAPYNPAIAARFRGYLPVVVDVETGGFDPSTDALLEIAAVTVNMDESGLLFRQHTYACHVIPFTGSRLDPAALAFTGIDPYHPFRQALPEHEALQEIFQAIRKAIKESGCKRAILVGHNGAFDLAFVNATAARCAVKRNPFHPFSSLDTATLSALAYGQTVLARALAAAGLEWRREDAHSAIYDAEHTADLFCTIFNRWDELVALAQRRDTTTQDRA
jgi:ribonuclease T